MHFISIDMTNLKVYVRELLFIVLLTLIVLLPISPLYISSIGRDSGVFLYMGWRILSGEIPYRDIWDHKPPIIFYLNALGLVIGQNSRWGVWFVEFLSLFGAIWLGFRLMKKLFGNEAAVLSSLLWVLSLIFLLGGGNFTTEYTLPLQFAALTLIYKAERSNFYPWHYFGLGLLGGVAFFTKQTAIGVWISIIVYLLVSRLRDKQVERLIKEVCLIASGSFVVVLGWVVYFLIHGALNQFWEAAFFYNFIYTSVLSGFQDRIRPIAFGIEPITRTGLLQISGIGYVLGVLLILKKRDFVQHSAPVLYVAVIDYPLELILISASGYTYPHYYMTLLPAFSLFVAFFFTLFVRSLLLLGMRKHEINLSMLFLALIFIWGIVPSYKNHIEQARSINNFRLISNYIRSNSDTGDYVLLWGAESGINFVTKRRSPTRFVYQYPLYMKGYVNEQMIEEFLEDIIKKPPKLIIDTHNPKTPIFDFPLQTNKTVSLIKQIQEYYQIKEEINGWTIYERLNMP